jgi:hypothetical protein
MYPIIKKSYLISAIVVVGQSTIDWGVKLIIAAIHSSYQLHGISTTRLVNKLLTEFPSDRSITSDTILAQNIPTNFTLT